MHAQGVQGYEIVIIIQRSFRNDPSSDGKTIIFTFEYLPLHLASRVLEAAFSLLAILTYNTTRMVTHVGRSVELPTLNVA